MPAMLLTALARFAAATVVPSSPRAEPPAPLTSYVPVNDVAPRYTAIRPPAPPPPSIHSPAPPLALIRPPPARVRVLR